MTDNETKAVGRPPVIDELTLQKLNYAFSIGASDREACNHAGICPATLYNYQKKNPEFLEQKECLKQSIVLRAREALAEQLRSNNEWVKNTTAKYLIDKADGKARQTVSAELDVSVNVIRKEYKAVPVQGHVVDASTIAESGEKADTHGEAQGEAGPDASTGRRMLAQGTQGTSALEDASGGAV